MAFSNTRGASTFGAAYLSPEKPGTTLSARMGERMVQLDPESQNVNPTSTNEATNVDPHVLAAKLIDVTLEMTAAQHGAFNARTTVDMLRHDATITSDGNVLLRGKPVADAFDDMKTDPEYAALWAENVSAGIGGKSYPRSADGKVDIKKLSPSEYMRLRKENPAALGL